MKFKHLLLYFILAFLMPKNAFAQLPDNLDCAGVRAWLRDNYYTGKHRTLGYSTARGYMYGFIDNFNDSLTCIYGGYKQYQRRGNTSTGILPINCEHTVPQSFFGSLDPMVSDLHHLFPTYDTWNNVRGNYPFEDVPDALTTQWMRNTTSQATIPTAQINEYAEFNVRNSKFEPREVQKGNTARAIFYFFTMYPTQAGDITRVASLQTLWNWHVQDPPDAAEIERTRQIETYQGDRNPFVDRPEWVRRAWIDGCSTVVTDTKETASEAFDFTISPNPTSDFLDLTYQINAGADNNNLRYQVLNGAASLMLQQPLNATSQNARIDLTNLPSGTYFLYLVSNTNKSTPKVFVKN